VVGRKGVTGVNLIEKEKFPTLLGSKKLRGLILNSFR
jgi:hypothetical protein